MVFQVVFRTLEQRVLCLAIIADCWAGERDSNPRYRYLVRDIDNLIRSCAKFLTADLTATGLDKGG